MKARKCRNTEREKGYRMGDAGWSNRCDGFALGSVVLPEEMLRVGEKVVS